MRTATPASFIELDRLVFNPFVPTMAASARVNKFHDSLRGIDREWAAPCSFEVLGFVRVVFGGFSFDDLLGEGPVAFRA